MSKLVEVIRAAAGLRIFEQRSDAEDYKELVFYTSDLQQWSAVLKAQLGPERKSAGQAPSAEDKELTKDFGGIRAEQTLYKSSEAKEIVVAMFWPWGDGKHITLKMARFDN